MTLLAAITNSAAAAAPAPATNAIVLTPGAAPPPPTSSALPTLIPPSDWSLSPADPALATAASFLSTSLSSASVSLPRFRSLLGSFLAALSSSLSLPEPSASLPQAIRSIAPYFPAALASPVASRASSLAEYDVLLALVDCGLLRHPPPNILSSLSEANRPDLVCAVVRQAADLRSSELLATLRFFLSPASDGAYDAMMSIKDRWKEAAVLAVNRCRQGKKADATARQAALLLMMGYDGFTSPEVCLHYLFASGNVDSMVFGTAVAELDGGEVARLMKYLAKWIGKYQRFPEAQPCPEAVGMPGLELCDAVPSFQVVAMALGLVLDQHFSHLVLNAELKEDLKTTEMMVKQLAAEAESAGPVLDLLRRLQQDV
ncbi:uncharacterized protein LOC102713580 [Oryza brachyantha]|uniref:Uncharacterized protein n=1 Tax=Oryza brachyantha TaxID=4533 RepID=J3KVT7_ORYBR|nr:uncharacterized protein LOC102713580 [Oryza brachyantha]